MKIKAKFLGLLATTLVITLSGCGGGGGGATPPDNDGNGDNPPAATSKFKYNRISIAGSSITHGNIRDGGNEGEGYLGELSYVGAVERYFRENVADTIGPEELGSADATIETLMCYQGKLRVYRAGVTLQGSLEASDEIAVVFGGSDEDTEIELTVDGVTYRHTIVAGDYLPVKKTFDDSDPAYANEVQNYYYAFRENNPQAVWVQKLPDNKAHTFQLTVKSGELHLNFITNHMYYFQNAGVGGFEAKDFLSQFRQHSTVKDIIAFNPDLFVLESSTNDAKTWVKDHNQTDGEESTNVWIVENPVPFTSSGKTITLAQNVTVQKGDVVIMGDYNGDIQNMAVGIVANTSSGKTIQLSKIVSYSGQNAHEVAAVPQEIDHQCRIKSIATWEGRVKDIISRLTNGVGHRVAVGIGTSGVPNYYDPYIHPEYRADARRLLGYREKGQMLADENGWFFADFFQNTLKVEPGVDTQHLWSYGDNTHPNVPGRVIFGNAVIEGMRAKGLLE